MSEDEKLTTNINAEIVFVHISLCIHLHLQTTIYVLCKSGQFTLFKCHFTKYPNKSDRHTHLFILDTDKTSILYFFLLWSFASIL